MGLHVNNIPQELTSPLDQRLRWKIMFADIKLIAGIIGSVSAPVLSAKLPSPPFKVESIIRRYDLLPQA